MLPLGLTIEILLVFDLLRPKELAKLGALLTKEDVALLARDIVLDRDRNEIALLGERRIESILSIDVYFLKNIKILRKKLKNV